MNQQTQDFVNMMMIGSFMQQQQAAQAQAAQAQFQQQQQQQQQQQSSNLQNQTTTSNTPRANTNPTASTGNTSTTGSSSGMNAPPSSSLSSSSSSYPTINPSSSSVPGSSNSSASAAAAAAPPNISSASSNNNPVSTTNPSTASTQHQPQPQQAPPAAPAGPPANASDDSRLEGIILAYLKKRGHTNAHEALKAAVAANSPAAANDIHAFAAELSLDQHTHLLKQVLHFSLQENSPDAYTTAFDSLKRWTSECLDVYRQELFAIQWPIYVHIFLQLVHRGFPTDAQRFLARFRSEHESIHRAEIHQFQNLTSDSELQKCDIARWFTQRKAEVQMSSFAHHLLISFLQENNCMLLLKIVNDHISIKVMSRKPLNLEEDGPLQATGGVSRAPASVTGTLTQPSATPLNPLAISYLNTTPIRWGVLPEVAGLRKSAREKLREKLSAELLEMKKLRNKEIEQKFQVEEEARKEKEKEAAAQAAAISQAAKDEEADGEEGATAAAATTGSRKKARTSTTHAATANADAAAGGDTEMTDAAAGEEGTEGVEAAKRRKPKRKEAAPPVESLKETAKEKEVLDEITRELIKPAESMVLPRKEELVVKLPPLSADAKAKYIADLGQRARLSSSSLPSICFYTFLNALHSVNSINISPDAALVSCGLSDSTVRLYDLRDPAIRQSTNPQAVAFDAKQSDAMDTSFDSMANIDIIHGSSIVGSRRDDSTSLPYSKLVGHSGPVYSTSLSPCNKYLLSGSEDATVRLWHLESKRNLVVYKGHNYPIWDVAFAPLGYYFATASSDGTARLWATQHVSPLRMFVGHNSDVDVVKFHPNNNYVATGSSDSTARLWDIQSGECVRLFVGHEGGVRSLAMDPEGRYMATGGEDGRVLIWDLGSGRQVSACQAHTAAVTSLEYSADATVIASGSLDNSIQLLEPKKASALKSLKTFHTKKTPVHYLSFTPRNLLLAAGVFNA